MSKEKNYCKCGEEIDLFDSMCLECYLDSPERVKNFKDLQEAVNDDSDFNNISGDGIWF